MAQILLVDDDVALTEMICEFLGLEGFATEVVHDGPSCLSHLAGKDLIVLDVMLPGLSGFEVLKKLRQTSNVPVIMLTARDGDVDRVVGLEIGADDYVSKPISPRELVARIRAILRRTTSGNSIMPVAELSVGDVRLNAASRTASAGGQGLDLTTAEFNLLEHLLGRAGQVVTREALSAAAFGRQNTEGVDRNVDTLVSKLRRKLGRGGDVERFIKTVRNAGYIYVIPVPELISNNEFTQLTSSS
jgi:two-component system response regulator CpxR